MHAESSKELWFSPHSQTPHVGHTVNQSMSGALLHLDEAKLPEGTEPLDELRGERDKQVSKIIKVPVSFVPVLITD